MLKRVLSAILSIGLLSACFTAIAPAFAADGDAPGYRTREVEYLSRGLIAIRMDNGVYLSWRLLGTEAADTTFDIYKNGVKIASDFEHTNYTDTDGFDTDVYQVAVSGANVSKEKKTTVWNNNYLEIPIVKPTPDPADTKTGTNYTYQANDASAADLDGDGEYEIILKWDPTNSKDNSQDGYTGNVYIDAYKLDGTMMWRLDLGDNIRAGAHYTQFIAYDFDGDGKAEVAMKTGPGSKDASGNYVSSKAASINGEEFISGDDEKDYRDSTGRITNQPDWITMFNGETGEAMQTINHFLQRGSLSDRWGGETSDSSSNYADRHLAGLAYLDGVHPSLIITRGYYFRAGIGAYDWDGKNFSLRWSRDDKESTDENGIRTTYSQGCHSLSIADTDNDGFDEIVFGSAVVDHDGSMSHSTGHGHGDALHVNDFNNDGRQEIFKVSESQYTKWGAELRTADGTNIAAVSGKEDVGRGVMGNIIESNEGSEFWSNADGKLRDDKGNVISDDKPAEVNFLAWWDGDLTRELLDDTHIQKYTMDENGVLASERMATFAGTHSNNGTKATPSLSADLFGDWREEVILPTMDDTALRIFTTDIPTEYKMTTLMHDTQYRAAIAWQNAGYNQPPHPSFYIGKEKTEYPQPDVKFASIPDDVGNEPLPDTKLSDIIPLETFDHPDMSKWSGTVTTEPAPYKNALLLTDTHKITLPGKKCVKITAVYNSDGSLKELAVEDSNATEANPYEDENTKVMYWESLERMEPITGDEEIQNYQFDFMWKPVETGSQINILDKSGANIFALSKAEGAVIYTADNSTPKVIDASLSKNDWYRVSITVDTVAKLVNCSIKDYSAAGTTEKYVSNVAYAGGDAGVDAISTTGKNMLDHVRVSAVEYTAARKLTTFNINDVNGAVSGAEIFIDNKTLLTGADGSARIMLDHNESYDVTVRKPGYKTYRCAVSTNDTNIDITLEAGAENTIYVRYQNHQGEDIAEQALAGTAIDNTIFTVPETMLKDITAENGLVYELDADITENIAVTVDGKTIIPLVYKEKKTPIQSDINPLRVNFGKNSIGRESWTSGISPIYRTDKYGINYGLFGNIGNDAISINLPAKLGKSYVIEYDMYISDITEGSTFSMVPYADGSEGTSVGFAANTDTVTAVYGNNTAFTYTNNDYQQNAFIKNKMMHVVILGNGNEMSVSVIDKDTKNVYINHQSCDTGGTEFDKLVFKRTSGNGDCSIGLGDLKAYTIGGTTESVYLYGSEVSLAPNTEINLAFSEAVHGADYGSSKLDMMNGLTYAITPNDGTVEINETTGLVKASSEAAVGSRYDVSVMYHGNAFMHVPVEIIDGMFDDFWTEDFEGNTHSFTTRSGSSVYWQEDAAKSEAAVGKIYGVGSGSTSTSAVSAEIPAENYRDVRIDLDFRLDAGAQSQTYAVQLLGKNNEKILEAAAYVNLNGDFRGAEVNGHSMWGDWLRNYSGSNVPENGSPNLKRDTTGWLHMTAVPDFKTQKVHVLITRKSTGSTVYSGIIDFLEPAGELGYISASGGRSYGVTWLDNIRVNGLGEKFEMTGISVTPPIVTRYEQGEPFNPNGMAVTAHYNNRADRVIKDGYTITGFDSSTVGVCTVTVNYQDFTATFDVNIIEPIPRVEFEVYSNDFENNSENVFTSANAARYESTLVTENGNTFEKITPNKNGDNGTTLSANAFTIPENTDYKLTFTMALTPSSGNNAQASRVAVRSASDTSAASDYILKLMQTTASSSASSNNIYSINGDANNTVELGVGQWYDYSIEVLDNTPYLTITDVDGNVVFERSQIAVMTKNGGLNGMYYETKRYSSGLAIDNIRLCEYRAESPIDSITVNAPDKTEYFVGEKFNHTGMFVTINYADGTSRDITEGYIVTGFDSSTAGECTVTVKYGENTAEFVVTITEEGLPEGVVYKNDFETIAEPIFTSNRTDRYVTALAAESGNTYEKISPIGDGNNGAYLETSAFTINENTNYTIEFDMALTPTKQNAAGNGSAQQNYFALRSSASDLTAGVEPTDESDYIFLLTQATANKAAADNTTYHINGDTSNTVTLGIDAWFHYVVEVADNMTYLTITDMEGNAVFEKKEIAKKTENGGLNGMYYATKRYSAGMAIDNILVTAE